MFDERGRTSGTLPRIRMGPKGFWREAFNWSQTTTIGLVVVLAFAALYAAVDVALFRDYFHSESRPQDPFLSSLIQVMTTVVGFLMVLRLNVGYQRWWEARTLWGGIINQSRNLAITILAHGPKDNEWRERAVRWVACFGHVARGSLRDSRDLPEVAALLGETEASEVARATHMASYVALRIGDHLREACDRGGMDPMGFLQADRERSAMINSMGGCERISRTPVSRLYVISSRRLIVLLILAAPFAGLEILSASMYWMVPVFVVGFFYPFLLLDEIAAELEDPFNVNYLGHLPLDQYSKTIEENLLGLIEEDKWHE